MSRIVIGRVTVAVEPWPDDFRELAVSIYRNYESEPVVDTDVWATPKDLFIDHTQPDERAEIGIEVSLWRWRFAIAVGTEREAA